MTPFFHRARLPLSNFESYLVKSAICHLALSIFAGVAIAQERTSTGQAFAEEAQQLERDAEVQRARATQSKLPTFKSDLEIDAWLRKQSAFYRTMAEAIDNRGGYRFRPFDGPGGAAVWQEGQRWIALNDSLRGGERINILIFELTNHFQEEKHHEITQDVTRGRITDPLEFAILCELVEYDGYRLLRRVLEDLDHALDGIAPELLQWLSRGATTMAECQIPSAYDQIKSNKAPGGLHDRYRAVFETNVQKAKESRDKLPK